MFFGGMESRKSLQFARGGYSNLVPRAIMSFPCRTQLPVMTLVPTYTVVGNQPRSQGHNVVFVEVESLDVKDIIALGSRLRIPTFAQFHQPRSQGCIRTTLAQSSDSSILIGRQFFKPNV